MVTIRRQKAVVKHFPYPKITKGRLYLSIGCLSKFSGSLYIAQSERRSCFSGIRLKINRK
ncbi:hypothetical cytosolic protein [Syntrophus aciditrophicus SB]|uniref:Hypothetical cytosolic protein n=1 Tax=Syntrophus aciditrophicus (strain SB) TaxID=56780 RepID=Q2LR66_SYNAS|nr:hypothetical cytosolic protein [Syntrophus aciditrophicus SB]